MIIQRKGLLNSLISFHGTAFSVLFRKTAASLVRLSDVLLI